MSTLCAPQTDHLTQADRAWKRLVRRRDRSRDRSVIWAVRLSDEWDDYTHQRRPLDVTTFPSW